MPQKLICSPSLTPLHVLFVLPPARRACAGDIPSNQNGNHAATMPALTGRLAMLRRRRRGGTACIPDAQGWAPRLWVL